MGTRETIIEVIEDVLCVDGGGIADTTRLEELGADSLDAVEIVVALECEVGEIPYERIDQASTVGDLIALVDALRASASR